MADNFDSLRRFLVESHQLRTLHLAFGEMLARRAGMTASEECRASALALLGAVALAAAGESHSCLMLEEWCQLQLHRQQERLEAAKERGRTEALADVKELGAWLSEWRLESLALKCDALADGTCADAGSAKEMTAPLVLVTMEDGSHAVYLNRFFRYEHLIAGAVRSMLAAEDGEPLFDAAEAGMLPEKVRLSSRNFSRVTAEEAGADAQQLAVCNALQRRFSIVTGGPGRGKTTVLADILALALERRPSLKIALCAPTGKAAARMRQAIEHAVESDLQGMSGETAGVLRNLHAQTVHSLLGIRPDSDYPLANRGRRLDYDFVAVDECSMMSLQLFAQLLEALKPGSRLLLLGDENQLASVDAGNVLAELCHCRMLSGVSGAPVVNRLVKNYRSRMNERLCDYSNQLVALVPRPDVADLYEGTAPDGQGLFKGVEIVSGEGQAQVQRILRLALEQASRAGGDGDLEWLRRPANVQAALDSLDRFKILCPVREGDYGVVQFNALMRRLLGKTAAYADGVPVLVTQNDSVTGLRNGDVGVCFEGMVHFAEGERQGGCRSFAPAQLPPHECAYAMTVHKSQGSDYGTVLIALPPKDNQMLLNRELVYTAITRTKQNCIILADRKVLEDAQKRPSRRWSGLNRLLR